MVESTTSSTTEKIIIPGQTIILDSSLKRRRPKCQSMSGFVRLLSGTNSTFLPAIYVKGLPKPDKIVIKMLWHNS